VSKPSRILDIHQHVFWHGRDDAQLAANLDAHGIDRAVLLNWDVTALEHASAYEAVFDPVHVTPGQEHPGIPFADGVRAARRFPEKFLLGYCPHPLDPWAIEHLDAAVRMYDVRLCGEWKATVPLDDPRCLNLFRWCGEHGLAVLFHIDVPYRPDPRTGKTIYQKEWYGGSIDNVERAVAACPDTNFLAHGPGFWRYISGDADTAAEGYPSGPVTPGGAIPRLLDAYANFHCDLSAGSGNNALARDPNHARAFIAKYHTRLFFGRDFYDDRLHRTLQSLDLPADAAENIYHRNAEKLLRIE